MGMFLALGAGILVFAFLIGAVIGIPLGLIRGMRRRRAEKALERKLAFVKELPSQVSSRVITESDMASGWFVLPPYARAGDVIEVRRDERTVTWGSGEFVRAVAGEDLKRGETVTWRGKT